MFVKVSMMLTSVTSQLRYDTKSVNVPYQVGDQVWLYVPSVKSGNTKKLASLWCGPYTVIDRINSVNYVQDPIDQSAF